MDKSSHIPDVSEFENYYFIQDIFFFFIEGKDDSIFSNIWNYHET